MRLAVLGARGLLGRHVVEELAALPQLEITPLDHSTCDIARRDAVVAATVDADCIINCAAFTNVDGAEADEDAAYRINTLGAENVAAAAAKHGAKLVHVSTDFVFDGTQAQPYDEFASANPQSVYARSKWAGETLAAMRCQRLFVVRVQGLYGRGGSNFSSTLRDLVLAGKPLRLDGERRVQPTWARAAARQIVTIAGTDAFGTYHVSCKGEATWAAFAERLAERLGVPARWTVVRTAELAAPASRPPNCLFRHRMLSLRQLDIMTSWESAQDEYLIEASA